MTKSFTTVFHHWASHDQASHDQASHDQASHDQASHDQASHDQASYGLDIMAESSRLSLHDWAFTIEPSRLSLHDWASRLSLHDLRNLHNRAFTTKSSRPSLHGRNFTILAAESSRPSFSQQNISQLSLSRPSLQEPHDGAESSQSILQDQVCTPMLYDQAAYHRAFHNEALV